MTWDGRKSGVRKGSEHWILSVRQCSDPVFASEQRRTSADQHFRSSVFASVRQFSSAGPLFVRPPSLRGRTTNTGGRTNNEGWK